MKKLIAHILAVFIYCSLFAGGIVTNTNQSASWVRLPSQDASTGIPAAYFNPAGLMKLNDGFHFSISNQTIFQNREIQNSYKGPSGMYGLNDSKFVGTVNAPIFPSVYAVYKMDRFALSFGFNPIGGGGGATFDKGLPAFELSPSDLVPSLASQGVTGYRLDAYFKGTSVFFGYQGGISFKINDAVSVYGGLRYVTAKNTYEGYLKDIELNIGTEWYRADAVMMGVSDQLFSLMAIPGKLAPIISGGGGGLTLTAAIADADARADIENGLRYIGVPEASIPAMTVTGASNAFNAARPTLLVNQAKAFSTSYLLRDQSAELEQTSTGYCPILGLNITYDKINFGIKYEFITKMTLVNNTSKDFTTGYLATGDSTTMFPDGEETPNDIPAMLSVGMSAEVTSKLTFNAGTHIYFDKAANYGKKINGQFVENSTVIDKNYLELSTGLEYKITDNILISGGYLLAHTGVNSKYQSDLSYSLTSHTIGGGGAFNVNDNIQVNLGVGYSKYKSDEKWMFHKFSSTGNYYTANESYLKDNLFVAVGVDFSF